MYCFYYHTRIYDDLTNRLWNMNIFLSVDFVRSSSRSIDIQFFLKRYLLSSMEITTSYVISWICLRVISGNSTSLHETNQMWLKGFIVCSCRHSPIYWFSGEKLTMFLNILANMNKHLDLAEKVTRNWNANQVSVIIIYTTLKCSIKLRT